MSIGLQEGSKSYHSEAKYYEMFSEAEDFPKKILRFIKPKFKGKIILDIGCGNGRYAKNLASLSKKYTGLDISKEQLLGAKRKTKHLKNVKFICSSAEKIPLLSNSVDIIISSWVISAIKSFKRKSKALKEAERVLKNKGEIYLIENYTGGEFEKIRGRYPNIRVTEKYNNWVKKKGFKEIKKINTYFKFNSLTNAREIIGSIWGKKVGNLVKNKVIKHRVIIFKKIKRG